MREILFLGKKCVGTKVSAKLVDTLKVFDYTSRGYQYGRKLQNGQFATITEDDLAREYLEVGKGIVYKGYIYFQTDKLQNNEYYNQFHKRYNRMMKEIDQIREEQPSYLNGVLYKGLKDLSTFSMVQSMIFLYEQGIFTLDKLKSKLDIYVKEEFVNFVLNEIHKTVKKAG